MVKLVSSPAGFPTLFLKILGRTLMMKHPRTLLAAACLAVLITACSNYPLSQVEDRASESGFPTATGEGVVSHTTNADSTTTSGRGGGGAFGSGN